MFTLEPGEALTLSQLAGAAGAEDVANSLAAEVAAGTKRRQPTPRGLVVLAGLFVGSDMAAPAARLLRRAAPSAVSDPYLGECVARLASRLRDEELARSAIEPAREIRRRAIEIQALEELDLGATSRQWLDATPAGPARAYLLVELARIWHRIDRMDIAVRLARQAVALDRDYPRASTTLAKIEGERGNPAVAAELSRGGDVRTWIDRALYLARAGNDAAAHRLVETACGAIDDTTAPETCWNLLEACRMVGHPAAGLRRRLDGIARDNPDAGMLILENLTQYSGGDHRVLNNKDGLQRVLRRRHATDLQPETYILPDEAAAARARIAAVPETAWFLKPARLFGGQGARLVRGADTDPAVIERSGAWVLQRYVDSPQLVDRHKAHMRAYLLVVPGHPRVIYVSGEGVVRLAPRPWGDGTGGDVTRHITNTNLHWATGELRIETDETQGGSGHVRRLSAVLAQMKDERGDTPELALRRFSGEVAWAVFPELQSPHVGLIAMDLMLDAGGRFHLLELESRPQFVAGGVPVVGRIHRDLGAAAWPILSAHLDGETPPPGAGLWNRL